GSSPGREQKPGRGTGVVGDGVPWAFGRVRGTLVRSASLELHPDNDEATSTVDASARQQERERPGLTTWQNVPRLRAVVNVSAENAAAQASDCVLVLRRTAGTLNGDLSALARADAERLFHRQDEDFAVPDLARLRDLLENIENARCHRVGRDDFEPD